MQIEIKSLFDYINVGSTSIPPIQRGLVWKPRQIELLWDSILSQFPIGMFTLIKDIGNNYQLYDGQQRLNAIKIGFDLNWTSQSVENILWLDLAFDTSTDPSRYFGFRLTTKAHPWGYKLNGTAFSTAERRKEIEKRNKSKKNKADWDIRYFRPIGAECPIPFSALTSALLEDVENDNFDEFLKRVKDKLKEFPLLNELDNHNYRDKLEPIYVHLKLIKDYTLIFHKIDDLNENNENNSKLELFFNRINTGGTIISGTELAYSAIKHYWGDKKFADKIREIANGKLPENLLSQIIFRFYLSDNKTIKELVKAEDIRRIKSDSELTNKIIDDIEKNLLGYVKKVSEWLLGDNISSCFYTEVAYNCPELFILLLKFAQLNKEIDRGYMNSMSLYLYFFSNNKVDAIRYIFKCIEKGTSISKDFICEKLLDCVSYGWLHPLPTPKDVESFKDNCIGTITNDWRIWNYRQERFGEHICQMFENNNKFRQLSMLRIAEREAFNVYFSDYNPINKNLWEDINRPWDNDHIIPKSWANKKTGTFKDVCWRLCDSIGNIALIPFEVNRSKNDGSDWNIYDKSSTLFHFEKFKLLENAQVTIELTRNEEYFKEFAEKTLNRFFKIYTSFIEMLSPLTVESLTPQLSMRQRLLNCVGRKCYYVSGEKEIEAKDNVFDWSHSWMSAKLGSEDIENEEGYYAVTFGLEDGKITIEIGVRKNPNMTISESSFKSRWKELDPIGYNWDNWCGNVEIYYQVILSLLRTDDIKNNLSRNLHNRLVHKISENFELYVIKNLGRDAWMVGLRHLPFSEKNYVSPLGVSYNSLKEYISRKGFESNNWWTAFKHFEDYSGDSTEQVAENILAEINELVKIIEQTNNANSE